MRRIAFYSYDEHGLGHVRRSIAIAHAIAADRPASILLVAGARDAALFTLPEGTDTLALPAPGSVSPSAAMASSLPTLGSHRSWISGQPPADRAKLPIPCMANISIFLSRILPASGTRTAISWDRINFRSHSAVSTGPWPMDASRSILPG